MAVGIQPWLCLYHWDLPQALQDRGGWLNRDMTGWFGDYAALVARRYGDRVKHFATFNEPSVFTLFGYGFAWHPPGLTDRAALHRAIHHVNLAHGAGVDAIRTAAPSRLHRRHPQRAAEPARRRGSPEDAAAARLLDAYWNRAFPEPQLLGRYPGGIGALDGVRDRARRPRGVSGVRSTGSVSITIRRFMRAPMPNLRCGLPGRTLRPSVRRSPIGWQEDPAAFRDALLDVHRRYRLPIYVTENGAGANKKPDEAGEVIDRERIFYLRTSRHRAARGGLRRRRRARLLRVVLARQLRMGCRLR